MDEANTRPNGKTAGAKTLAELGAALRELREEKGLSLDDVSADTYIRQNFLTGIENGDFSSFKALVYARGFVRSYANYLGAPELWDSYSPVLTLENFEPAKVEAKSRKYRAPEQQISMMLPSSARAGIGVNQTARGFRQSSVRRNCIIALAVILAACGAALLYNWEKIQNEIASVQSRQAYDTVKSREAEQALHEEQVKAEEEAVAQELREQNEAAEGEAAPEPAPLPEPEPEPAAPKPELTIRATGDCWMRVSSGDSKIFEGVVKTGWERTFPLDAELTARYGRGQNVRVSTNGKDFTSPGTGVQRYRYGTDGTATKVAK